MKEPQSYRCDECDKVYLWNWDGWITVFIGPGTTFKIAPLAPVDSGDRHYCGEPCVMVALSEFLSQPR